MIDRKDDEGTRPNADETEEAFLVEEGLQEEMPSEGEGWQDELPPEDDFHDVGEASEEAELQASSGVSGYDSPEGNKTRGKNIFWGVLGVSLLLVGGLMYLQFGGSGGEGSTSVPMASVMGSGSSNETPKVSSEPYVTPTTGETDMASLYSVAQQQAGGNAMALPSGESFLGQGADKSSLGSSTEIITDTPQPSVAKVEDVPLPAAPEPAKKVEQTPSFHETSSASSVPEASQAQPQNPSLAEADSRLKGLGEEVERLKKELDSALQQNVDLVKRLESTQGESIENEKQILRERVTQLEQQLAEAKKAAPKSRSTLEAYNNQGLFVEEAGGGVSAEEQKPMVPKAAKKSPVKKKKEVAQKKKKALSSGAASSPSGWVLRAATPDAAWVSTSSHASELRRVGVGESLPGIGRVVEIRQNGDVWEVVGSSGTLR